MDGERTRLTLAQNPIGQALLLTATALLALGAIMVFSASASVAGQEPLLARREVRHVMYAALALAVLCTLWRLDYRWLGGGRRGPLPAAVLLLVAVGLAVAVLIPGVGREINGARRWLHVGPAPYTLSFQPSELVKLTLVIFLAYWLGGRGKKVRSFTRTYLPAIGLIGACAAIVIVEDFGTGCIIAGSAAAVLLLAGVPGYYLLTLVPLMGGAFYLLVVRNENRWARIESFFGLGEHAEAGLSYQVDQALIAIGSGGLQGKGLGAGALKLGYLPEDNTDFIFAVICEELGFLGAVLLLGLLAVLLYASWRAMTRSTDRPGQLLAGGLGLLLTLQALLHVAVNTDTAPPTGVSLPLVSAGGTALVLVAAAVAMIISVTAHPEDPAREFQRG